MVDSGDGRKGSNNLFEGRGIMQGKEVEVIMFGDSPDS